MVESVHFRCTFDLEPSTQDGQPFSRLVDDIAAWIRAKEGTSFTGGPWLARSGDWKKPSGRATVTVDSIVEEGADAPEQWAMRYRHQDGEFSSRWWTIDFGANRQGNAWRLSVAVGHALRETYLGKEPGRLPVTAPKVVKDLVTSGRWHCRAGATPLGAEPVRVDVGRGHLLRDAITASQRGCPLLYVSRDRATGEPLIDSKALARALVGAAVVYEAATPDLDDELEYLIPREFRAPNGQVRVYAPGANLNDWEQSFRHRFFTRQQIELNGAASIAEQISSSLARRSGWSRLAATVANIDDIAAKRRESRRAALQASESEADRLERLQLSEMHIAELEQTVAALRSERDSIQQAWEEEADKLAAAQNDLARLRFERDLARNDADDLRTRNRGLESAAQFALGFNTLPGSLSEALALCEQLHGDRIAFTDEAKRSAKEAAIDNAPGGVSAAWECLHAAAVILPKLAFEDHISAGTLPVRFQEATGLELTMTEGKMTKSQSKLRDLRTVEYSGKEWDVSAHIKYGTKAPRCLRIHFALDGESRRVIVGHCGDHLDTAGTRRRGQ